MPRRRAPEDRELLRKKQRYYSGLGLDDFRRRRAEFLSLDLSDPAVDAVAAAQEATRSASSSDHLFPFSWNAYLPGEVTLWRARAIDRNKGIAGFYEEDPWDPPPRLGSAARMGDILTCHPIMQQTRLR